MAIFTGDVITGGFSYFAGRFPHETAKEMGDAAWKTAMRFRSIFIKFRLSGRPGLNRVTGALIRSFRVGRSPRGAPIDRVVSWLASRSPYGPIHETGGTIRPVRRRMLAVPLPAALTKAGAVKGEAVRIAGGERTLYARTDLVLIKSRRGNLVLVKKLGRGKRARIVPMYVLKDSVRIPARMKFYDTFSSWAARPAALRYFSSALRRLMEKLAREGGRK